MSTIRRWLSRCWSSLAALFSFAPPPTVDRYLPPPPSHEEKREQVRDTARRHEARLLDQLLAAMGHANARGWRRNLVAVPHADARADGYQNTVTGIGDYNRDKTFGGQATGPTFVLRQLAGSEIENRWRGSDLGARIVETRPAEMLRRGWDLTIQPDVEEEEEAGAMDADDAPSPPPPSPGPEGQPAAQAPAAGSSPPAPAPGPKLKRAGRLPDVSSAGTALAEAMDRQMDELQVKEKFRTALEYETAFGGGAILMILDEETGAPQGQKVKLDDGTTLGADDFRNLTAPLDESKIRHVKALNVFRGGWDGEVTAWRYYSDPRKPRYGEPEIYQLRNIGVSIASPAAPGEAIQPQQVLSGPTGPTIFYVHESRLILFPGRAITHWVRNQQRGWGDSIFCRVDEVLSDFDQGWGGVSILLQEFSQVVLKVEGLSQAMAKSGNRDLIAERALQLQMAQSIARARVIDSKEEIERLTASFAGVPEVLQQLSIRLAAAADIPVDLLMGMSPAGLNATGDSQIRSFYDRTEGEQQTRVTPQLRRLTRLIFLSSHGPSRGVEPKKWTLTQRPLWQLSDTEKADLRSKQASVDAVYLTQQVVTPEEIAASRFGGSEWSSDTILDLDAREQMASLDQQQREARAARESTRQAQLKGQGSASNATVQEAPQATGGQSRPETKPQPEAPLPGGGGVVSGA